MSNLQPYEENYGVQSTWPDGQPARPHKITATYFVDVDGLTVAKASNEPDIRELLKGYPEGRIRLWSPTQDEYEEQLKANKELVLNNWGIMAN